MKKEKGSLTVEALIILMIFMFGMLAMLNIINMVRTQVVMQNCLNKTAKEVSQYSYILYRFGYLDYLAKTNENAQEFDKQVKKYTQPENATAAYENLQGIMSKFSNEGANSLVDEVVKGVFGKASSAATDGINDFMTDKMVEKSINEYMNKLGEGAGPSEYLKQIGIIAYDTVPGECEYCIDEDRKIVITMEYKLEYKFPFIDLSFDVPVRLAAVTSAWAGGVE